MPCGILDAAILGETVLLAAGKAGLLGVDISDPAAPHLFYHFGAPSLITRVGVDGDRIYALDE